MRSVISISIITSIILSGCSNDAQVINVPQKCVPDYVAKPDIDNSKYTTYPDIIAKAISNESKYKAYSEKLEASYIKCR